MECKAAWISGARKIETCDWREQVEMPQEAPRVSGVGTPEFNAELGARGKA